MYLSSIMITFVICVSFIGLRSLFGRVVGSFNMHIVAGFMARSPCLVIIVAYSIHGMVIMPQRAHLKRTFLNCCTRFSLKYVRLTFIPWTCKTKLPKFKCNTPLPTLREYIDASQCIRPFIIFLLTYDNLGA